MEPITVKNGLTITKNDSEGYFRAKNSKMGDVEITGNITKKHINIFNVLRAKDGDETTLSKKDLKRLSKDDATLRAFGYEMEHEKRDVYTLKSEDGETLTFDVETFGEKVSRKIKEFTTKRAERKAARRAEKEAAKEQRYQETLEKNVQKFNSKYGDKISVENTKDGYNVTLKKDISIRKLAGMLRVDPSSIVLNNKYSPDIDWENDDRLRGEITYLLNTDTESEGEYPYRTLSAGETFYIPIER